MAAIGSAGSFGDEDDIGNAYLDVVNTHELERAVEENEMCSCPFCGAMVARAQLNQHASVCLDSSEAFVETTAQKGAALAHMSLQVGDRVLPGPNWRWGHQNVGPGNFAGLGTVVAITQWRGEAGAGVRVRWDHGATNIYRFGAREGGAPQYDLRVVSHSTSHNESEGPRIPVTGVLFLRVMSARDIPSAAICPAVELEFEGVRTRTPASISATSATWEFQTVFRVPEYYAPSQVNIQVQSAVTALIRKPPTVASASVSLAKLTVTPPHPNDETSAAVERMITTVNADVRRFSFQNVPKHLRLRSSTGDDFVVLDVPAVRSSSGMNPCPMADQRLDWSGGLVLDRPVDPALLTLEVPLHPSGVLTLQAKFVSLASVSTGSGPLLYRSVHWLALCGQGAVADAFPIGGSTFRQSAPLSMQARERSVDGLLPADLAAAGGTNQHLEVLKKLHVWSSSHQGSSRNTLHMAVLGGHAPTVSFVLSVAPALTTQQDPFGLTPFALACALGRYELAKILIAEDEASRQEAHDAGRGRLLHNRWHIGPAAEVLSRTASGDTCLMLAAQVGTPELVKLVLHAGALVNAQRNDGDTPLHIATRRLGTAGQAEAAMTILEYLLRHGATFMTNAVGETAFHIAAQLGHLKAVQLLWKQGEGDGQVPDAIQEQRRFALKVANSNGATAEAVATAAGASDVAALIRQLKASAITPAAAKGVIATPQVEWGDDDAYMYMSDSDDAGDSDAVPTEVAASGAAAGLGAAGGDALNGVEESKADPVVSVQATLEELMQWSCQSCTFLNSILDQNCTMCGMTPTDQVSGHLANFATVARSAPTNPEVSSETKSAKEEAAPVLPLKIVLARQTSEEVIDSRQLAGEKMRVLKEVAAVLGIPVGAAGTLLRRAKWDVNQLADRYMAEGMGMVDGLQVTVSVHTNTPVHEPDETVMCGSCCDDIPAAEMYSLACGHEFCKGCWEDYLATAVGHGPVCMDETTCMMGKEQCSELVDEVSWQLLARADTFELYERFLLRSYIQLQPSFSWCPNPAGCTKIVKYDGHRSDIQCECGYWFCVNCGLEAHSPAGCDDYLRWKNMVSSFTDKTSVKMMLTKFKRCPKCKSFIEKNMGCKHMTCRNPECRHEFCWNCKATWTGYSHRCETYSDVAPMGAGAWNASEVTDDEKQDVEKLRDAKATAKWTYAFQRVGTQSTAQDQVAVRLTSLGVAVAGVKPPAPVEAPEASGSSKAVADAASAQLAFSGKYRGTPSELMATAVSKCMCTYVATGATPAPQPMFMCNTCGIRNQVGICVTCVKLCHLGHDVRMMGFRSKSCSCGLSHEGGWKPCKARQMPSPLQLLRSISAGESKEEASATTSNTPRDGAGHPRAASQDESELSIVRWGLANLLEFHNLLKFCYIYDYFHDTSELLKFKVSKLEMIVEYLFALTDTSVGLAGLDVKAIQAYTNSTRNFASRLMDEITESSAYRVTRSVD